MSTNVRPARTAESRLVLRLGGIGFLGLLMLIPLAFVGGLVSDRGARYEGVLYDIAATWGDDQVLQGPLLVVPYVDAHRSVKTVVDDDGVPHQVPEVTYHARRGVFLPDSIDLQIDLQEERRYRGIYESLVYTADVSLSGEFGRIDVASLSDRLHKVEWDKAIWVMGLSDTGSIANVDPLTWDGSAAELAPGVRITDVLHSGFHAPIAALSADDASHTFSIGMTLRGSGGVRFAPTAKTTDVRIRSPWQHPSFQGSPDKRTVDASGFDAAWTIPHLTRNYPQQWTLEAETHNLHEGLAGVDLFEPVALYDKVGRAVKYGLLFIFLTFLIFVLFELVSGVRLRFVQYGLVGLALCLFYLTLLALAEHTTFIKAYFAAALVAVGMVSAYTMAALRSVKRGGLVAILLAGLYAVLFAILRMEDYALLAGAALLLTATAALMYATRSLGSEEAPAGGGVPSPPEPAAAPPEGQGPGGAAQPGLVDAG
ncbi:MAG: cell envelope integrity protein CreD [Deltaproteobacteria bacterium]|nr:cell envelope integrity protein CreD [Deltaproteobacteria bacterium]